MPGSKHIGLLLTDKEKEQFDKVAQTLKYNNTELILKLAKRVLNKNAPKKQNWLEDYIN